MKHLDNFDGPPIQNLKGERNNLKGERNNPEGELNNLEGERPREPGVGCAHVF
jgi:hypothetical protein